MKEFVPATVAGVDELMHHISDLSMSLSLWKIIPFPRLWVAHANPKIIFRILNGHTGSQAISLTN